MTTLNLLMTLDTTQRAQSTKEGIDELDLIKIINSHSTKDYVKRMKRQTMNWEKISPKYIL